MLFGRAEVVGDLAERVAGAVGGAFGSLLLTGEAGVGKTALLREVSDQVSEVADVIWATCLPMSSLSVPFLPLISAVERRSARIPPAQAGLNGSAGHAPVAFDAWLSERCVERPVMLVVDDLQWADQSTLDVLLYVLAGPAGRRLLVVPSVRDGEERPLLSAWLANVRRLPCVDELRLERLTRVGVEGQLTALLHRPPHQSFVDQVYERSRGNPYLTQLLARAVDPDAMSLPTGGLPRDLRDAATVQWHRLSPGARTLTRMLAVTGRPQGGERLTQFAAAVGVGADLVALLREAVDSALLEVGHDGRYWFVHPLLAEVLVDMLLAEERRAVHAALVDAIGSLDPALARGDVDSAVSLADHHAGAGHHEEAFRWALIAAGAAEVAGGQPRNFVYCGAPFACGLRSQALA